MSWSFQQQQAITSRNQNLLVAAAAGSGKTSVLVERIIQRLLDTDKQQAIDINQLLVVTFTKAAAAEMRGRIGQALTSALEKGENRRHIERQLVLLNSAAISTLHSFCQSVVRQYFYRLDLDPAFRLGGAAEIDLIKGDALETLFGKLYEEGNEGFYHLIDHYGGERDNDSLIGLILKLHTFSCSHPWPEHWLRTLPVAFSFAEGTALDDTVWSALIREKLAFELEQLVTVYDAMVAEVVKPGQPVAYLANLAEEQRTISAALSAAQIGWLPLAMALDDIRFEKLPSVKKTEVVDEVKVFYQNGRQSAKDFVKNTVEIYFSRTPSELLSDMAIMAPVIGHLVDLTLAFHDTFQQAKKAKGLLDFNDLEHYCLAVLLDEAATPDNLVPSAAARELQERFAEVMTDEYQDTNGVQETILRLVSRDNNRFMVGDVKQSIYRFRLAEPSLFMDKYNTYPMEENQPTRRIDLSQNFRSQAGILHGANFLFKQLMTRKAAEMDYGEKEQLNPGLDYPCHEQALAGPIEVLLIDRDGDNLSEEQGQEDSETSDDVTDQPLPAIAVELSRFEQEAWLIARRMVELKQSDHLVYDKNRGWRTLDWRDMVVLLRAPSGKAGLLLDVLRHFGIPAYADEDSGYFQATEVKIMLALLAVIDNPRQDIELAAVLRSPLVGLSVARLAELRLAAGGDLWHALTAYCDCGQDAELLGQVTTFLTMLREWRSFARRRGVAELIWRLYRDTGYYDYVGGMPGGSVRQANLRALYDRARQYEATNFRGLFRFLRFLQRLVDDGSDMAVARMLGEGEDVVRVMSIHKSKGLEFPVVFVADIGKQFNLRDAADPMLLHKTLGLGPYYYQPERRFGFPTLAWHGISHRLTMESKAEELRIFYVALTRAREKLILVGSAAKLAEKCALWGRHITRKETALPDGLIATARTGLDWLVPAIMRHPDGEALRLYGNCAALESQDNDLANDRSRWDIRIISPSDIALEPTAETDGHPWLELVSRLEQVPVSEGPEWVAAALNWRYKYQAAVAKPAKLSVTEIKRRFEAQAEEATEPAWKTSAIVARPRFIQTGGNKLTGVELGTIMHTVMQRLDFTAELSATGIAAQVSHLVSRHILLPAEAAAVNVNAIATFFASPLGQRLVKAKWVKKEMAFSLLLPAERFYSDLAGTEEKIFVQGIVDCLFVDGDGLVLIDYKTDRVTEGRELIPKYAVQLKLYVEAVQTILQQPVKEVYLYVFHTGEVVEMEMG